MSNKIKKKRGKKGEVEKGNSKKIENVDDPKDKKHKKKHKKIEVIDDDDNDNENENKNSNEETGDCNSIATENAEKTTDNEEGGGDDGDDGDEDTDTSVQEIMLTEDDLEMVELLVLTNKNEYLSNLLQRLDLYEKVKGLFGGNSEEWTENINANFNVVLQSVKKKIIDEIKNDDPNKY